MSHLATLELAQRLMACPSLTPHDAGCQTIISDLLASAGFTCETLHFGEVENLWARLGDQSPLVVFAGHTDVVPTGPLADWTSPPFSGQIRDEYLYGRGAADMKGAVAAMVIAALEFVKANPKFPGSIAFLITSDEEGPSINGTQKVIEVLQQRNIKIDYCIIGEPSSDKTVGDQIRIGRRGSLHGKLVIHGKQGHVAHPQFAINPIHIAAKAIDELAHTQWDKGNEDFPPTTFQITNINAGTGANNVIPGHLELTFNFRFSTALTIEQIREQSEDILRKYHLKFDSEWREGAKPFLSRKGKLIPATQEAIKAVTGLEVILSTGGGTSDGRFIAPTGAELVELGVSSATAHHVNECVKVQDLEKLTTIYIKILEKIFT